MELRTDQRIVCEVQGCIFQMSARKGYASKSFIYKFMNSQVVANLDLLYDRSQWMGEEFLFDELEDECSFTKAHTEDIFNLEVLFWIGYLYRYWHYYKQIDSKGIYAIADAELLNECWLGYHTLDLECAIDRLIEGASQPA